MRETVPELIYGIRDGFFQKASRIIRPHENTLSNLFRRYATKILQAKTGSVNSQLTDGYGESD